MRKITKTTPPIAFENFKSKFKTDNGRDALFADLRADEKRILKEELLKEQFYLCCYCMKKVS